MPFDSYNFSVNITVSSEWRLRAPAVGCLYNSGTTLVVTQLPT